MPGLADLPVIFISAYGRAEFVARALDGGAVDYIVKPFSPHRAHRAGAGGRYGCGPSRRASCSAILPSITAGAG